MNPEILIEGERVFVTYIDDVNGQEKKIKKEIRGNSFSSKKKIANNFLLSLNTDEKIILNNGITVKKAFEKVLK